MSIGHSGARLSRRRFLNVAAASSGLTLLGGIARPHLSFAPDRPRITHGVQSGDVSIGSGVVWARADRPARMLVEVSTTPSFKDVGDAVSIDALPETDCTAKVLIDDLPAGQDIFYRVRFQDLSASSILGEPQVGHFRTPPADRRSISFTWSGDSMGQGWGIDPAHGGMRTYAIMLRDRPLLDVFLLDMRSYRGPNGDGREEIHGPGPGALGPRQVAWLKRELARSNATWKVIAADLPLGLVNYDGIGQGDGPPRGRELEIAGLLSFVRRAHIVNTVWVTADVHYTAAHYYEMTHPLRCAWWASLRRDVGRAPAPESRSRHHPRKRGLCAREPSPVMPRAGGAPSAHRSAGVYWVTRFRG